MALMLRGLGWVCLASDAPSTPHSLGWGCHWFWWSQCVTAGKYHGVAALLPCAGPGPVVPWG